MKRTIPSFKKPCLDAHHNYHGNELETTCATVEELSKTVAEAVNREALRNHSLAVASNPPVIDAVVKGIAKNSTFQRMLQKVAKHAAERHTRLFHGLQRDDEEMLR